MLLAIDAGNNNVKFAVYSGELLIAHWRIRTQQGRTSDEYTALLEPLFHRKDLKFSDIHGVALASVVPQVTPDLLRFSRETFDQTPMQINQETDTGLDVKYRPASDVGADRLVDAAAASRKYGAPCIVVDFGTGTTFNAIGPPAEPGGKPAYLGGAICPGIGISLEALYSKAARLSPVALAKPPKAIADNTTHALQSGILFGYVAQVDGMVTRFRRELGFLDCPVIATGGHAAELIAAESDTITTVDPLLTLDGLRLVYERNHMRV